MPPNRAIHKGCSAAGYTYPKGRLLPSCFGLVKFSGFQETKTSANKRFLIICLPSQYDFATAKVVNYFGLSKKNSILLRFLFRNWQVNHFRNRVNLFRNGINLFRERVNFFRKPILRKVLLGREEVGLVFSRSSLGRRSVELGKV